MKNLIKYFFWIHSIFDISFFVRSCNMAKMRGLEYCSYNLAMLRKCFERAADGLSQRFFYGTIKMREKNLGFYSQLKYIYTTFCVNENGSTDP